MGRTYRGVRKDFGSRKSKNHKSRSKWSARNGIRLRTLNVDLQEFREHEDSLGISLHRAPDAPNRGALLAETIQQLRKSKPPPPVVEILQGKPPTFLESLGERELEARKAHAGRQVSYLTRLLGILRREDSSFNGAILRFEKLRRFWNKQAGTIGPILTARKTAS